MQSFIKLYGLTLVVVLQTLGSRAERISQKSKDKNFIFRSINKILLLNLECEEYGHLVYKDEPSPLLHAAADFHSISKCGIVEIPLIVGGVKAS